MVHNHEVPDNDQPLEETLISKTITRSDPPCLVPLTETDDLQNSKTRFPWRIVLGLCSVGFMMNCLPSEPFLTQYLKHDKNLTDAQLDNDVWPSDTYATFVFLLPVGLLAEIIGYRKVIAIGIVFREATRLILLYGEGVGWMVVMQIVYAGSTCVDTIYYAYVYMVVPKEHFQLSTALVHGAYHLGNVLGSAIGQLLVSFTPVKHHFQVLFYISWGVTTLGLVAFVFFLPKQVNNPPESLISMLRESGLRMTMSEVRSMFVDPVVVLMSLWWVFGFCSYSILVNYYQVQFSDIDPNGSFGTVEILIELFDFLGSLAPVLLLASLARYSSLIFTTSSALVGVLFYLTTVFQSHIMSSYVLNIAWMAVYSFQIAAASALIALFLSKSRYAVLFTLNTFVSFALATVIQVVGQQLNLSTDGYYYIGCGVQAGFLIAVVIYFVAGSRSQPILVGVMPTAYRSFAPTPDFSVDSGNDVYASTNGEREHLLSKKGSSI
jgi:thiamine transporter 2/3